MNDQIHLVVATPCFGGQVSSIYASSIFQLQRAVRAKSNIDLKVLMRDGDALITRARANLVTMFLDDPAATHFLFVDADIGFTPDQVYRLLESEAAQLAPQCFSGAVHHIGIGVRILVAEIQVVDAADGNHMDVAMRHL